METLGAFNSTGLNFLTDIGQRISALSGDARETSFLLQRISVAVQRYNSIIFRSSFHPGPDDESWLFQLSLIFNFYLFLALGNLQYREHLKE